MLKSLWILLLCDVAGLRNRSCRQMCAACVAVRADYSPPLSFSLSPSFSPSVHISDYSSYSRQATRSEYENSDSNLTRAQIYCWVWQEGAKQKSEIALNIFSPSKCFHLLSTSPFLSVFCLVGLCLQLTSLSFFVSSDKWRRRSDVGVGLQLGGPVGCSRWWEQ